MSKGRKKNIIKKFNISNEAIIALIVLLVFIIFIHVKYGALLAAILLIGIGIIIGIAKLFDLVKYKKKKRRLFNMLLIIFFLLAITICLGITGFCIYVIKASPEFDITKLTKKEASIIFDKDGNEIGKFGSELRENVVYDDLPEIFIDALIATEDSRFFQHNGFDAPRFLTASFGQVLGKDAGGASTLSMQVIKNTFTDPAQKRSHGTDGIVRKFEDIYLAVFKLEKNYTKEEIIEYYVNNLDLANNAFGVEQESQVLFGKSVSNLNLAEAATLVGIFNNPTKYNPRTNPSNAAMRRNTVLNQMVEHGYITKEEADIASNIPVESLLTEKTNTSPYQAYIDTVYEELTKNGSKWNINPNANSILVYTNMDAEKQKGLDDIFNGVTHKWENDYVQSGVAVIDVNNGNIVAIGVGRNKTALGYNRATMMKRQIGSTAKPIFVYGPAIEYLNWSTYQQIIDEPYTYSSGQSVNNADGKYAGQLSIRTALSQSRNVPALKTFHAVEKEAGNKKIVEFATNLGMTPQIGYNGTIFEAHALGSFDGTSPLQMAAAYAAFANGGTYYEPSAIAKVVYRDTNEVVTVKQDSRKAMSEATAYMITEMLRTSVQSGAAGGLALKGVNLAAKTGTTNFGASTKVKNHLKGDAINDAWICGYDTQYSIAMWYGYDEIMKDYHNRAATVVGYRNGLFKAIENIIMDKDNKEFVMPKSVSKVCVEVGHMEATLPSDFTPADQITCEWFKKGTEPDKVSTAYQQLSSVSNLNVTYDKDNTKVKITWDKVPIPADAEESYGPFGYKVYYGKVLLGFTTDNYLEIPANANISGTYSVITTYEIYTNNQSQPSVFNYTEPDPTSDENNNEENNQQTP